MAIDNRQLAIGNELAVAEGFEPSHGRINSAVPYQLGYATEIVSSSGFRVSSCACNLSDFRFRMWMQERTKLGTWNSELETLTLEAMKGVEPLSSGLQDRRSVIQLSYIADFGEARFWWS